MRILVANKFWYARGGLERVMFDEIAWLESAGHEVAHFSTRHPQNVESPWAGYFAPYLELGEGKRLPPSDKARAVARMFRNVAAARLFDGLITDFRPDVVHLHGIHRQISPSILGVARRRGLPVVQTLHDYHHLCPADVLLYKRGEVCEPRRCGTVWYGPAVTGRCVRGSTSASLLSAGETGWQRLLHSYERGVARFICPSEFMAAKMADGGWAVPSDVVRNAASPARARAGAGTGFCVIGRLAREKGVEVAAAAAQAAGVALTVAGDGPMEADLREKSPSARFVGQLSGSQVEHLLVRSRAVIVPSLWYENAPMAILEAMAVGVPIIASRIGGIPEQVDHGRTGLLVEPGNVGALAAAMCALEQHPERALSMGDQARAVLKRRFSPERHLEGILASYRAAGAIG